MVQNRIAKSSGKSWYIMVNHITQVIYGIETLFADNSQFPREPLQSHHCKSGGFQDPCLFATVCTIENLTMCFIETWNSWWFFFRHFQVCIARMLFFGGSQQKDVKGRTRAKVIFKLSALPTSLSFADPSNLSAGLIDTQVATWAMRVSDRLQHWPRAGSYDVRRKFRN